MSTSHSIPNTRGGRLFRGVLLVVGISSIVGIAGQIRALIGLAVAGPSTAGLGAARALIILAGWIIMCWCSVRAWRSNVLPPLWAAVTLPLLVWAYILWPS